MNCPFYGRHMYRNNSLITDPPFLLLDSRGNQCGLVTSKLAPCMMERGNEMVDWSKCPLLKDALVGERSE